MVDLMHTFTAYIFICFHASMLMLGLASVIVTNKPSCVCHKQINAAFAAFYDCLFKAL